MEKICLGSLWVGSRGRRFPEDWEKDCAMDGSSDTHYVRIVGDEHFKGRYTQAEGYHWWRSDIPKWESDCVCLSAPNVCRKHIVTARSRNLGDSNWFWIGQVVKLHWARHARSVVVQHTMGPFTWRSRVRDRVRPLRITPGHPSMLRHRRW